MFSPFKMKSMSGRVTVPYNDGFDDAWEGRPVASSRGAYVVGYLDGIAALNTVPLCPGCSKEEQQYASGLCKTCEKDHAAYRDNRGNA